jgi:hypothetical protein
VKRGRLVTRTLLVLFIVSGDPHAATAQVPTPSEYVSVGDYSGTANERIAAAIAAAMATEHKTVYFPNGTYALRTGLNLNQGANTEIHLIGESRDGVLLVPDVAYLEANYDNGSGAQLAHMMNLSSASVFQSVDVSIQNMTLDMRNQLVMGETQTYSVAGHGVRVGTGWETGQFTVNEVTIRNAPSYGVGIQDRGGHSKNNVTLTNLHIERIGSDAIDTKEAAGDGNRNLVIRNVSVNEIGFLDTGATNAIDVRYRDTVIENVNLVSAASYSTLPGQTSNVTAINFRAFESGAAGIVGATVSDVYIRGFATGITISSSTETPHENIDISDFLIHGQTGTGIRTTGTNHSGHTISDGFIDPAFGTSTIGSGIRATVTNVTAGRWDPALTPTTTTTFERNASLGSNESYSPAWEGIVGSERISLNPTSPVSGPFVFDVGSGELQVDFDTQFNVMDKLFVGGTLNLDGRLRINAIGGVPTAGGTYQLFEADSITGSFDTFALPSYSGFTWVTDSLATNGTISLQATTPVPVSISVLGTAFAATNADHTTNKPAASGDFTFNSTTKEYAYAFDAGVDSDMLVVSISVEKSTHPLAVTYGGEALTEAVSSSVGSGASLWYLANPGASGELVIDASDVTTFNGMGVGIASLSSLDDLLTEIALHSVGSSTNSASVDLTTTIAGSFVMVAGDANSTTGSVSLLDPLSLIGARVDVGSSQAGVGFDNGVAAGSRMYSWSPSASERGMVAASFVAVPEPSPVALLAAACLLLAKRCRQRVW